MPSNPPVPAERPGNIFHPERPDRLMSALTLLNDALVPRLTLPGLRRSRRLPDPRPAPPLRLAVRERRQVAEDAVELTLARPAGAGGPLPSWQPGCHLDVTLPSGRVRQYSLCGDPDDRGCYRIAVRRLDGGRGGSLEVHQELAPGRELTVSGPRNAFPFAAEPAVLLLAGGIGITPVLPMAREAARRGLDWRLVHTGRSRDSLPFRAELEELSGDSGRVRFHTYDTDGFPDAAELLAQAPRPDAAVYCCGPTELLDDVRLALPGTRLRALHAERFSPAPVVGGKPFRLRLGDGTEVAVPADRTALDALLEARPQAPFSCRQGFCGTCRVTVRQGTPEHRDHRLTDQERADGSMLICVSRAPEGHTLEIDA
ncbi:PDR/VanB family oxidoreductase [Phaeacidiphilus oryzae]|uniref:PDR/VanB family oxidoreductase n=1 Tax=Phaeacidiphilus oryzae TaxID=348818 RepID=UPI00056CA868|nr:PDR/VanB family oxidoreductase [Phaeacidiphilus oryzae]